MRSPGRPGQHKQACGVGLPATAGTLPTQCPPRPGGGERRLPGWHPSTLGAQAGSSPQPNREHPTGRHQLHGRDPRGKSRQGPPLSSWAHVDQPKLRPFPHPPSRLLPHLRYFSAEGHVEVKAKGTQLGLGVAGYLPSHHRPWEHPALRAQCVPAPPWQTPPPRPVPPDAAEQYPPSGSPHQPQVCPEAH